MRGCSRREDVDGKGVWLLHELVRERGLQRHAVSQRSAVDGGDEVAEEQLSLGNRVGAQAGHLLSVSSGAALS